MSSYFVRAHFHNYLPFSVSQSTTTMKSHSKRTATTSSGVVQPCIHANGYIRSCHQRQYHNPDCSNTSFSGTIWNAICTQFGELQPCCTAIKELWHCCQHFFCAVERQYRQCQHRLAAAVSFGVNLSYDVHSRNTHHCGWQCCQFAVILGQCKCYSSHNLHGLGGGLLQRCNPSISPKCCNHEYCWHSIEYCLG